MTKREAERAILKGANAMTKSQAEKAVVRAAMRWQRMMRDYANTEWMLSPSPNSFLYIACARLAKLRKK